MEYVDGLDLSRIVKARGPLPVANACNYAHQAALGLQHAHERGLVHRDIKPSNLMLTRQGDRAWIMVLDFGLAKVPSEGTVDDGLTQGGQVLGTPAYVAPEQISDAHRADIRADIYSLGCTLYYLLTGDPPFQGTSFYEVLQAHHSTEAKPLDLARPEVPAALAALVARMMAKEPNRRFQEPKEVAQALTPFFKKGGVSAAGSMPEFSRIRPMDRKPATAGEDPVSTRLAAGTATALEPRGGATAQESGPGPVREDSIDLEETERSWDEALAIAKTRRPGPPRIRTAAAAGAILAGVAVAWTAWALNVQPKKGVLVLQNVPENCAVEVDGKPTYVTPFRGRSVKIETRPGNHDVTVKQGDHVVLVRRVTLKSGQVFTLPMPEASTVPARDAMLVLENLPPDATVEVNGERAADRPVAGVPFALKVAPGPHIVVVRRGREILLDQSVDAEAGKPIALTLRKVVAGDAVVVVENMPPDAIVEVDGDLVTGRPTAGTSVMRMIPWSTRCGRQARPRGPPGRARERGVGPTLQALRTGRGRLAGSGSPIGIARPSDTRPAAPGQGGASIEEYRACGHRRGRVPDGLSRRR